VSRTRDTPPFPLGPALDFLQWLWRLDQALEQLSSRLEQRLGITTQQRLIVRCVGRFPGMTAGQLAGVLHVDPGTVSAALGRLEAKALVSRRKDPGDSRRVHLGLTAKGRALDVTAAAAVEEAVDDLLATTSPAELAQAVSVIARLTSLLQARSAVSEAPLRAPAAKQRPPSGEHGRDGAKRPRRPRGAPVTPRGTGSRSW
jgi:DNA-binding MarR family transcriptional regulator